MRCNLYSKLTIKSPERRHCRCSAVLIVDFKNVSHFFLMFLVILIVEFEQVNVSWGESIINGTILVQQ